MKKFLMLLAILPFLTCCQDGKKSKENKTQTIIKKSDTITIKSKKDTFKDVYEFIEYNDDFDYTSIYTKKGKDTYSFVNDRNENRSLLRGDICEIQWEKDTIYIAGDGETPEIADLVISIKKIKDGNVSKFRKEYKTELKYHWSKEENYSQSFLDKIYLLTEYYIANSKNELLKVHIKNKDQISYSIENQKREDKDFTIMGIGYEFENRSNIFQWLYYNNENGKLYEYDLPNDKLNEFQ